MKSASDTCYCHSKKAFAECCQELLNGSKPASTPESLMRSRFSAFCTHNIDYIERTTDPKKLSTFDRKGTEEWALGAQFTKLEIIKSSHIGTDGVVEFKAYFRTKSDNSEHIHHEISMFKKTGAIWYFRSGRVL